MNQAIYDRLVALAHEQRLTNYSEIAPLAGLSMDDPNDRNEMSWLLEEIARHEQDSQRPMLTALVVHHGGDNNPGDGFFTIAEEFGLFEGAGNPMRRLEFWVGQVRQVYDYWANH